MLLSGRQKSYIWESRKRKEETNNRTIIDFWDRSLFVFVASLFKTQKRKKAKLTVTVCFHTQRTVFYQQEIISLLTV